MISTKRIINDKNDKNFQSNLTLYEHDRSTKTKVRTLGVKFELEFNSTNFVKNGRFMKEIWFLKVSVIQND